MSKENFLVEVSWEVCNKVGGIYTVITSKLEQVKKEFGEKYYLIGPLLNDQPTGFIEENNSLIANIKHKLENLGIQAKVGKWAELEQQPSVILIKINNTVDKDKLLYELWEDFGVDSMRGGWDYIEPVMFGHLAGKVIGALGELYDEYRIIAHFHEWMSGAGVLYLKKYEPHITTVFTTHATILGRSMAGNSVDLYSRLENLDPHTEAYTFNVPAKYSMEKTSAREADCFTTVSDITAVEAENILGVKISKVLPNGFNVMKVPDVKSNPSYFKENRAQLLGFASKFLQKDFDPENTLIISTSGRYEYHNKGIDVLLDALGKIKKEGMSGSGQQILCFLFVLAGSEEMSGGDSQKQVYNRYSNISTHPLWHPSSDFISNACRNYNLINQDGDRINIIFVPVYLNGNDGILNMKYYDALSACDLSVYASYYEPWGYTPLESIVHSVPTVTTDLAGFGQWVMSQNIKSGGVYVMKRLHTDYQKSVDELESLLLDYSSKDRKALDNLRMEAREIALKADWEEFYVNYLEAYEIAEKNCSSRLKGFLEAEEKTEEIQVRGTDSSRPRLRSFTIKSSLPAKLKEIRSLAYNIWYSWTPEAHQVFNRLDSVLYDKIGNNPVSLIETIESERFREVAESENYMTLYENVIKKFKKYLNDKTAIVDTRGAITKSNPVAYFSMEFGFHESLPIYSGGLGILSGDHIKSASDINLDLIGVGLLYKHGYFKQGIALDGSQKAVYFSNDFYRMPLEEVKKNNKPLIISVDFPGRTVYAKAWKANVGRIAVYFLDSYVLQNNASDREITARLYGGGKKVRIEQEIILGIGGIKLLQELNITPSVYHLNEGHSAFLIIQRLINQMKYNKLDFHTSREVIKASTVFTTHTPVPAGNEVFDIKLVESYLRFYVEKNGLNWEWLNELARRNASDEGKYEMTVLALTNSFKRNGVSKLHGLVSRNMWAHLWSGFLHEEIPVGHITNGVHLGTWLSTSMKNLFLKHFSVDFHEEQLNPDFWQNKIESIPDMDLWQTHVNMKSLFFDFIRSRVTMNWTREGEDPTLLDKFLHKLTPGPLTIGFARRFATYKRATLLFKDFERFKRIVSNSKHPVQFVFAGKAHPDDVAGQNLIREIVQISKQEDFLGKVIFLEDYDINLARKLVSSVDVWLNNPVRPNEASGTSGMKAGMNGVLNCSIMDGWWDEGYNGENGWSFGEQKEFKNNESQNIFDSDSFYDILENEIIPFYYTRNSHGVPEKWIAYMKSSMATVIPKFNTHRMLWEYVEQLYVPAAERYQKITANNFELAKSIADWTKSIRSRFSSIHIQSIKISGSKGNNLNVGDRISIQLELEKGKVEQHEIKVQALVLHDPSHDSIMYNESQKYFDESITYLDLELFEDKGSTLLYKCIYKADKAGKFNYGIRVMPYHMHVDSPLELNLVYWA